MQIFIYRKVTLHLSGVKATIIWGTKNSLVLLVMGVVTSEICRLTLQEINICTFLHLVGFLLTWNYDARKHEIKILFHVNFFLPYADYSEKFILDTVYNIILR
jgi:hypothetical protein